MCSLPSCSAERDKNPSAYFNYMEDVTRVMMGMTCDEVEVLIDKGLVCGGMHPKGINI